MKERKDLKVRVSEELKETIVKHINEKRTTLQMFIEDAIKEKLEKDMG